MKKYEIDLKGHTIYVYGDGIETYGDIVCIMKGDHAICVLKDFNYILES